MKLAPELSVSALASEDDVPMSEVLVDGRSTGSRLKGAVLEAAVQRDHEYLLFLTDDVPFEELLRVVLVDQAFREVESLRIGGAYTTGHFSSLALEPPDAVRFRFIGDTTWRVMIARVARPHMPFVSDPPGVRRSLCLKTRLLVSGDPSREV